MTSSFGPSGSSGRVQAPSGAAAVAVPVLDPAAAGSRTGTATAAAPDGACTRPDEPDGPKELVMAVAPPSPA